MSNELNTYVHALPSHASFTGKGLLGYAFGPLNQNLDVYYVDVEKGHDVFMISKKITRTYYVLSGTGHFTIDNREFPVAAGMLVEVPPKVEYCYSGKMKLLALSIPRWFSGNDTFTKWNPDVVGADCPWVTDRKSLFARVVRMRVFGKSPTTAFLRVNQWFWNKLPVSATLTAPVRVYGELLHSLARINETRAQAFSTFFLRNRPQLELIRRTLAQKQEGETLKVAVLGCSTGAEAYSVAWTIRSARPDIRLALSAVDISKQAVEFAKRGVYSLTASQLTRTEILSRTTPAEVDAIFDRDNENLAVKPWLKDGINWSVGDVSARAAVDWLGTQDIVIANNFLCHMQDAEAENCLRNIARIVNPNGYLFALGVDLDVRTKVAIDLGWKPIEELLEEVHEGDEYMRSYWPCQYGGLEPLNKKRQDWRTRYAAAFQIPASVVMRPAPYERDPVTA